MEKVIMEIRNCSISFGEKDILNIDHLTVLQLDRIGIVGKNGSGKSTLLKLLAGEIQPDRGTIQQFIKPAYFEQVTGPSHKDVDVEILSRMGNPQIQYQEEHLSGGEETKLKLAQVFSTYHDAVLLDEPTTHLDQIGRDFLLEQLEYYYGAVIIVSHDRDILDKLVSTIWEVSDGKVTVYKGNYTDYKHAKELKVHQQIEAYELFTKERERLKSAARDKMEKAQKLDGTNAKSKQKAKEKPSRLGKTKSKSSSQKSLHRAAKSIENRLDKLPEVVEYKADQPVAFLQSKAVKLHNKVPIVADRLTLAIDNKILLEDVSFQIPLGSKVAILGPNGSGKSTLLRNLMLRQQGFILSPKAKIGFFEQMSYRFTSEDTVISFLKNRTEHNEGFLRAVLAKMHLEGQDLRKKVTELSGGEAVRLQLCYLFLGEFNILLLDEPTNFLDVQAMEALEKFILEYQGTILFVTHDRTMIERVADTQLEINPVSRSILQIK